MQQESVNFKEWLSDKFMRSLSNITNSPGLQALCEAGNAEDIRRALQKAIQHRRLLPKTKVAFQAHLQMLDEQQRRFAQPSSA